MYNTTGVARGTLMYSIPPAAEETCWQSDQMNYWVSLSAPDHALIIARTERRNVINGERERERAGNKRREGVVGEAETTKGGKKIKEEWRETKKEKENLTYMSSHGIMIALYSRPSSVVCVVHMWLCCLAAVRLKRASLSHARHNKCRLGKAADAQGTWLQLNSTQPFIVTSPAHNNEQGTLEKIGKTYWNVADLLLWCKDVFLTSFSSI